jgi:hypothetical protein
MPGLPQDVGHSALGDAGFSQTHSDGVAQIVNVQAGQATRFTRTLPGAVVHRLDRPVRHHRFQVHLRSPLPPPGEHELVVLTSHGVDDRLRNAIAHDDAASPSSLDVGERHLEPASGSIVRPSAVSNQVSPFSSRHFVVSSSHAHREAPCGVGDRAS